MNQQPSQQPNQQPNQHTGPKKIPISEIRLQIERIKAALRRLEEIIEFEEIIDQQYQHDHQDQRNQQRTYIDGTGIPAGIITGDITVLSLDLKPVGLKPPKSERPKPPAPGQYPPDCNCFIDRNHNLRIDPECPLHSYQG